MQSKAGNSSTLVLVAALFVITLLASGSTFYFYNQYQQAQKLLKDPTAVGRKQGEEIKVQLSKFMVLPSEPPTIATVTDVNQLKAQEFFRNAQNGDKLVIFPKARKAILWRPSTNKIIETAPINIGESNVAGEQVQQPTQPATLSPTVVSPTLAPTIRR